MTTQMGKLKKSYSERQVFESFYYERGLMTCCVKICRQ